MANLKNPLRGFRLKHKKNERKNSKIDLVFYEFFTTLTGFNADYLNDNRSQ